MMGDKPDWADDETRKIVDEFLETMTISPNISAALRLAYAAGYRAGQERMRAEAEHVVNMSWDQPPQDLACAIRTITIEEPPT
jgi:hypothetical protein